MGTLWHRVTRWVTWCGYTSNPAALQAQACLPLLWHLIELLQTNFNIRINGIRPSLNPATQRLPHDFPTPWGKEVLRRTDEFFEVKETYRHLPCCTIRRYDEPCIRLLMDDLADKLVPLLHTSKTPFPDRPRLPTYKNSTTFNDSTLPHGHIADVMEHLDADLHLRWGLETARAAPFDQYPVPTCLYRFMHLTKLQASRINCM